MTMGILMRLMLVLIVVLQQVVETEMFRQELRCVMTVLKMDNLINVI